MDLPFDLLTLSCSYRKLSSYVHQNLHKDVNNRITHNDQNLKVTKKFSVTENIGSKIIFKAKVKYDPSHEKIDKRIKYISLRLTI